MKKLIFSLMFCITTFAVNPLLAMEKQEEDSPWHITIVQKFHELSDSVTRAFIPHKCSVCTGESWSIDPNDSISNGAFTSVSDDVTLQIIVPLPPQNIFLLPSVSKKIFNIINCFKFWDVMENKNKVHVSKELCLKQKFSENYKYYTQYSSGLFEKWGEGITYSVKNPIFFSFMEKPRESTWHIPFMIYKGGNYESKYYSFSIGQKPFELYVLYEKGAMPKWMQEAKENPEGETLFTSVACDCYQAGAFCTPTCFIREIK